MGNPQTAWFVMITGLCLWALALEADASLLEKAETQGCLYKLVEVIEKPCQGVCCLTKEGKTFLLTQRDKTAVTLKQNKNSLELSVSPDQELYRYYLYVREKYAIRRIELTKRTINLMGADKIFQLQLIAVGPQGPLAVWGKTLQTLPLTPFVKTFTESINRLRNELNIQPLSDDPALLKIAEATLKRTSSTTLSHINAQDGSIGQSGIRALALGENLFRAESLERAWQLMVSSPSHYFNLVNPDFKRMKTASVSEQGMVRGAVIFSD